MRFMFAILIQLPFISFCQQISGTQTCIIGYIDRAGIYVAAESRVYHARATSAGARDTIFEDNACKILQFGVCNVAIAGLYPEIARSQIEISVSKFNTVKSILFNFDSSYQTFLTNELNLVYRLSPTLVDFTRKQSEIILFGYQDQKPYLIHLAYFASLGNGRVIINPSIVTKNIPGGWAAIGQADEIGTMLHNPIYWVGSLPDNLIRFIQEESRHQPKTVGGPIDIIFVTGKESIWIQQKASCK
jgi:hypothetical protein